MKALESAIEDAKRHTGEGHKERGQPKPAPLRPQVRHAENLSEPPPLVIQTQSGTKYKFANIKINLWGQALHEVSREQLAVGPDLLRAWTAVHRVDTASGLSSLLHLLTHAETESYSRSTWVGYLERMDRCP